MAAPTPYSYRQYQGDGATRTYSVPFPYLKRADVRVSVDGTALVEGVGYSWTSNTQIQLTTATNKVVEVRRTTPEDLQLVQWMDGSYIVQEDLNTSDLQWLYLLQEHHDLLQDILSSGQTVADATETTKGIVRLATLAETAAGTSKLLAVHPAGVRAEIEKVEAVIAVMEGQINGKAPLANPNFTGTPTAPTPSAGDSSTRIATTGWAKALLADKAPLDSPALTGTPTAPTAATSNNSTQIATTAFVKAAVAAGGGGGGGTVVDATETDKGIVQLATAAEAAAGLNSTKAVHPVGLKAALDGKASLASPAFTGAPTAPTAAQGTNSTQLATTAFVNARTPNATETVVGMVELATTAESQAGTLNTRAVHPQGLHAAIDQAVASYAPLFSPDLAGTPTAPTATAGTNTTQLATTAFVQTAVSSGASIPAASETVAGKVELATAAETTTGTDNTRAVHPAGLKVELDKKANLASPSFSGTPVAPTAAPGTNTTQIATTAFVVGRTGAATELASGIVELANAAETSAGTDTTRAVHPAGLKSALDLKAPLTSPALTGTPTAPTAAAGTNNTQLATTAFVTTAVAAAGGDGFYLGADRVEANVGGAVFGANGILTLEANKPVRLTGMIRCNLNSVSDPKLGILTSANFTIAVVSAMFRANPNNNATAEKMFAQNSRTGSTTINCDLQPGAVNSGTVIDFSIFVVPSANCTLNVLINGTSGKFTTQAGSYLIEEMPARLIT